MRRSRQQQLTGGISFLVWQRFQVFEEQGISGLVVEEERDGARRVLPLGDLVLRALRHGLRGVRAAHDLYGVPASPGPRPCPQSQGRVSPPDTARGLRRGSGSRRRGVQGLDRVR